MAARKGGKTTTERGLGWDHQQTRKRLLAAHVDGSPCGECGRPMWKFQSLDADHEVARHHGGRKATRLLHASCNRRRKDGSKPSVSLATARAERDEYTVMDWWS